MAGAAAAAAAALLLQLYDEEEAAAEANYEEDRVDRPTTLDAAVEMLGEAQFLHETRFGVAQFKYLCHMLEVPLHLPTQDQRLANTT
jgi:hypothetical protein